MAKALTLEELNKKLKIAVKYNEVDEVVDLIDLGADINTRLQDGSTLLMQALYQSYFDLAKKLIDMGVDVHSTDIDGNNALMSCAVKDKIDLMNILIGKGVDVDLEDSNGDNALTLAARSRSVDAVKVLVAKKCNINHKTNSGEYPLQLALPALGEIKPHPEKLENLIKALLSSPNALLYNTYHEAKWISNALDSTYFLRIKVRPKPSEEYTLLLKNDFSYDGDDNRYYAELVEKSIDSKEKAGQDFTEELSGLFNELYLVSTILLPMCESSLKDIVGEVSHSSSAAYGE